MREVIVDVDQQGNVKFETRGYKGKACKEATKSLEKALGGTVISDVPTREMHQQETETVKAKA